MGDKENRCVGRKVLLQMGFEPEEGGEVEKVGRFVQG